MYLYPRLSSKIAKDIARECCCDDPAALRNRSSLEHEAAIWSAVGGTRIKPQRLERLRELIHAAAEDHGWPSPVRKQTDINRFDSLTAVLLHKNMHIIPGEASKHDVWSFLACVVFPDLVRWRFPGGAEGTSPERYLGGVRNTFQRLWWRAETLNDPSADNDYRLLQKLGEDELVQIMERPVIAGNMVLARSLARNLSVRFTKSEGSRMKLMREAAKRLVRHSSLVSFDSMLDQEIDDSVSMVFDQVMEEAV